MSDPAERAFEQYSDLQKQALAWRAQRNEAVAKRDELRQEVATLREGGKQLGGVIVRLSDELQAAREERDARQAAIDHAYDAAMEFEMGAALALVCVVEWLGPYITVGEALKETNPEPTTDGSP